MKSTIIGTTKKRGRGRPPTTGIGTSVNVRLHDDALDRLDAWITKQGEPNLSRPEAIRRVLDQALPPVEAKPRRKRKAD
jgi:hypothetical protein